MTTKVVLGAVVLGVVALFVVVATGRAPSGTSKTLIGSIPARAAGTGPVDLVPWLVLGIGVVALATWLLPRLSWRTPGGSEAGSGLDVLADR